MRERQKINAKKRKKKKKEEEENAFALVVTPLSSLESREFTIPERESIALNVCTHIFCMATRMLAHISMQQNTIQTVSGRLF